MKVVKVKVKLGDIVILDKLCVWVIDFKGSMDVYEVNVLCEEVMVVLVVVKFGDWVVVCLESFGGVVYGYGLVVL